MKIASKKSRPTLIVAPLSAPTEGMRWTVTLDDGRSAAFDHDPTDDEVVAALPDLPEVEPTATGGRKAIFRAAADAARDWSVLRELNTYIQDPATAATNKQKTGAQALVDRAYTKARRLAAAYADAVAE